MQSLANLPVALLLALPFVGAYAMFGLGIVTIYRASRVLNLAHGGIAMFPAFIVYQLAGRELSVLHRPAPLLLGAMVLTAVLAGGVMAVLTEVLLVRRLRSQGPTAQTVGTVAVLGLSIAVAAKIWGTTGVRLPEILPRDVTHEAWQVGNVPLAYGKVILFFIAIAVTLAVFALFRYTSIGLAMRGSADNRRAASLMGIDPDRVTSVAWFLGGTLAALGGILLGSLSTVSPYTLSFQAVPAFVAALIGGLESLPGVIAGAAVVGAVYGAVPALPFGDQIGAPQLVLTLVAFAVMILRGKRFIGVTDVKGELAGGGEARGQSRRGFAGLAMAFALAFPWLPGVQSSTVATAGTAWKYAIVAVSLVVLTGWVGQISLAQAAFVGVGAFVSGLLIRHSDLPGFSLVPALPFPLSLPVAALITGAVAAVLGMVALRVRGLYLAVATMLFAWMCDSYLFQAPWLVGGGGSGSRIPPQTIGSPGSIPFLDFFNNRYVFYYAGLGVLVTAMLLMANLRRMKAGRAMFAVRGSEIAAASLGIDVTRYKLLAFALAGTLAGAAGNLWAVQEGTTLPDSFTFTVSLFFLSMAVVGGLQSLGGAVVAALLFAGLSEVFFRGFLFLTPDQLAGWLDIVTAGLLAAVLLVYPNGLAALPNHLTRLARTAEALVPLTWRRQAVRRAGQAMTTLRSARVQMLGLSRAARRAMGEFAAAPLRAIPGRAGRRHARPPASSATRRRVDILALLGASATRGDRGNGHVAVTSSNGNGTSRGPDLVRTVNIVELPPDRESRRPVLEADGVTVRFGGLTAVSDVSLSVREREITGLIGPNGAGKTTMFNAISGLNEPASGRIQLFGQDVTNLPVHARARLGVGRTFQVIQLFPQLDVFENLLVATHSLNPTGVLSQLVVTRRSVLAEREARQRVERVIDLLELRSVAHRPVTGLPFGVLRMVEVARVMVTGAELIMLDEPASGLDNSETDRLAEFLGFIRATLGVTLLLIEHDVHMVTRVCDHIYVLDRGKLLADGPAERIKRDPEVVAAYLGTPAGAA